MVVEISQVNVCFPRKLQLKHDSTWIIVELLSSCLLHLTINLMFEAIRSSHFNVQHASDCNCLHGNVRKTRLISSALPETAASMVVTAVAVGAAATLLVRRTKASEALDVRPQIIM